MKHRSLHRLVAIMATVMVAPVVQGQGVAGAGKSSPSRAQISRLKRVTYQAEISRADLVRTGGSELLATGAGEAASVARSPAIDLEEAIKRARKYASTLLNGGLDTKPPLWRLESAAIVWVSSEEGLGYYCINFQPRSSAHNVHDGAVDMLSVVVLFSGDVVECKKVE
ncbi:MAG: hypothetical protein QM755_17800 [Luteolibacter sp.]